MNSSDSQQIPIRSSNGSSHGNATIDGDDHQTDAGFDELSQGYLTGSSGDLDIGNANTDSYRNEHPITASSEPCENTYLPTSEFEDEDSGIIHPRQPFPLRSVAPLAYDGLPVFGMLGPPWWEQVEFFNPNSRDLVERASTGQLLDSEVPLDGLPRLRFTRDGFAILDEDGVARVIPELFGRGPPPTPSDGDVEFWPESSSLSGSDLGSYSPPLRSQSPCSSSNESDVSAIEDARRHNMMMDAISAWTENSGHGAYQRLYNRRLYGYGMRRRSSSERGGYDEDDEDDEDDEYLD